jgi:hypothetical protein
LFGQQKTLCRRDLPALERLIGNQPIPEGVDRAEAAAWIGLARTVLNFDEFITRE